MHKRTSLLFAFVLGISAAAFGPADAGAARGGSSCLQNPPPNCEFDPVCTEQCVALHPKDAEARCQCSIGCCLPIE